jgi:hypothetical protein
MKIAFDVNGVLRDTFLKAEQVYQRFMIDDYITEEGEEKFNYELNLPVTSMNLIDHFTFRNTDDLYDFFYVDFPMQIFGHAPSVSANTFTILNEIYQQLRDDHEIYVISDEIQKSKPATLFFISKYGCLIENYMFYSKVSFDKVWETFDIIITSSPEILDSKPNGKKTVKFLTTYNENESSDYTIFSLEEFTNLYTQLNLKNDKDI